ncbi:MAG: hypothetical protein M3Y72_23855 [Acidobacteriota bacterium]|nr:hypothetical protein [Acidobacteriota bacterium]
MQLLAEGLARCYAPGAANCSAVLGYKNVILKLIHEGLLIHEGVLPAADWTWLGSVEAYKICGKKEDISFLEEQIQKVEKISVVGHDALQDKLSRLDLLNKAIKQIKARETG